MKKFLLSFFFLCFFFGSYADEGMWLPFLIGKNMATMQAEGCQLTDSDIYNVNHSSLKDAIVIFGGGCTGEMVSPEGLLMTNYHCGYGSIASLSSVAHNYIEKGFWAKDRTAELSVKGLSVKFLIRMEDVTKVIKDAGDRGSKRKRQKRIDNTILELEKKAEEAGKYLGTVKPFFEGNQYFLLVYQVFTDVRLVAAPPKTLGQFGGNTTNWMWPRHTCDFSVFRVYADSNNRPAPYSIKNVPYHSKKYLTISLKGEKENDFSLIMGYPGRTNRHETSYGVAMALDVINPSIVKIRDLRLSIMRKGMEANPETNIKLATEYAQIANYWKYYIGQTEQLRKQGVQAEKQKQEQAFTHWAKTNQPGYSTLMSQFARCYATYQPFAKQTVYYREAFGASKLVHIAIAAKDLYQTLSERRPRQKDIDEGLAELQKAREHYMEDFVPKVEREMFARMAQLYYEEVPKSQQPSVYQKLIFPQFNDSSLTVCFNNFTNYTFSHTFLLDNVQFAAFSANPTLKTLQNDPAIIYALSFVDNFDEHYLLKFSDFKSEKKALGKQYIAGLMAKDTGKLFYPDANGSMRVSYGKVTGYSPEDAIYYGYHTSMKGLLSKYTPANSDFDLPTDFVRLAEKGNFGPYANNQGGLTTCFITNNDITGGNSGSPVMNSKGELIGLAFDGNWEAMSGDIAFDKQYKRAIVVDIRYVLWVMDYYGHAKNLISELTLKR